MHAGNFLKLDFYKSRESAIARNDFSYISVPSDYSYWQILLKLSDYNQINAYYWNQMVINGLVFSSGVRFN